MRTLPRFGEELASELEQACKGEHGERERRKLQVIRLVAQHKLTAAEIAEAVGLERRSVFRYIKKFTEGGVAGLLAVNYRGEGRGSVDAETLEAMQWELYEGNFVRAKDAQGWLAARKIRLALTTVYYWLSKSRRGLEGAAQDPRGQGRGGGRGVQAHAGKKAPGAGQAP